MKVKQTKTAFAIFFFLMSVVTSSFVSSDALAQDARARANDLFQKGNSLYESGRYGEACTHYEQANELYPKGLGIRVRLGICYRKVQKLAHAYEILSAAHAEASAQEAELTRAGDKEKAAAAHKLVEQTSFDLKELELKLSWVTFTLSPDVKIAPGLEIQRDGVRVDWTNRVPVEKGAHAFLARSMGKTFWSTTLDIPRIGSTQEVAINEGPAKPASKRKTVGYVVIGAGAAIFAGGAALTVVSLLQKSDNEATGHCNGKGVCDSIGLERFRDAKKLGIAGDIAFGVGGFAIGLGIAVAVSAPKNKDAPAVQAFVGPQQIGFRGVF